MDYKVQSKKFFDSFTRYWKSWTLKESIYAFIVILTIVLTSVFTMDFENYMAWSIVGIVSSIFGVMGTMSAAKRSAWNYFFGLTHIILYGASALNSRLYGDFMLNYFFFIPTNIYGAYLWAKNKDEDDIVIAKTLTNKQRWMLLGISVVVIIPYALILEFLTNHFGGAAAWFDSMSTVLSVVGMFLMMKMFTEQWIVWFTVNIVSTIMWLLPLIGGDLTAVPHLIMWAFYIANSVWGWMNWSQVWIFNPDYKEHQAKRKEIRKESKNMEK